jgi:hypothetical protein
VFGSATPQELRTIRLVVQHRKDWMGEALAKELAKIKENREKKEEKAA